MPKKKEWEVFWGDPCYIPGSEIKVESPLKYAIQHQEEITDKKVLWVNVGEGYIAISRLVLRQLLSYGTAIAVFSKKLPVSHKPSDYGRAVVYARGIS
jgi:hypothetical protein